MNDGIVVFESQEEEIIIEETSVQPPPPKLANGNVSTQAQFLMYSYEQNTLEEEIDFAQPTINVGRTLGKVAVFYERIRNAIDYKGEHLLRRNAIERILRRRLWQSPGRDAKAISKAIIKELIWAKYLKNSQLPKEKVVEVQNALLKYFALFDKMSSEVFETKRDINTIREWILGIAASEIEEILDPSLFYVDRFSDAMYSWFGETFVWEDDIPQVEKDMHLYIAIHKSLPKSDEERLRYHLLKKHFVNWDTMSPEEASFVAFDVFSFLTTLNEYFLSDVQKKLYRFVQKYTAPFQIFREFMERNPLSVRKIVAKPKKFERELGTIINERYEEIGKKVRRGIVRSIVYIFVTKVLVVLLIEVPYEVYIVGAISYLPLIINLVTPPLLMFLVGLTIKKPGEKNTERLIARIKKFVYNERSAPVPFSVRSEGGRGLSYRIFVFVYAFLVLAIFGGISYFLISIGFNLLSAGIFFMFLSLVLLFGFRVRYTASELNISREREGFFSHLLTNLSLPFLNLGVYLSKGLRKLNFLIILMDFLIEAPLKSVMNIFEDWMIFVRERKEEVVEVPTQ